MCSSDLATNLGLASLASPTFTGTATIPTLTVSTSAGIPLGSAASPTLFFTGDTNTGLYSPGADQLALATGGSGRLFIDSSGLVGVGVTPTEKFQVGASSNATVAIKISNSVTSGYIQQNATSGTGALEVGSGAAYPLILSTNNTERLRITSAGLVGIGVSSPSTTLHVNGDGTFGSTSPTIIKANGDINFASNYNGVLSKNSTYVYVGSTNNAVALWPNSGTNANPGLIVDSSNRVGIGTTAPGMKLTINDTTTAQIQFGYSDSIYGRIGRDSSGNYEFSSYENGGNLKFGTTTSTGSTTERARIDSSGRLLVGTSSAIAGKQSQQRTLQIAKSQAGTDQGFALFHFDNSGQPPNLELGLSKNNTLGSHTAVGSGDNCGSIKWSGSDGTGFVELASINGVCDGATGTNDMPGRLVFSTTADGASSPTERMRIRNDGTLTLSDNATQDPIGGNKVGGFAAGSGANSGAINYYAGNNPALKIGRGDNGTLVSFFRNQPSATEVGTISVTTTATAYNTSSDYRLKENVVLLTGAADRLNQLQVHRFNFIADPGKTVDGFIAHEAQVVVPECVTGEKDAVDDEGNPIYQGIDQSKLVPLLTAALQEALAKIETLEARLTAAGI